MRLLFLITISLIFSACSTPPEQKSADMSQHEKAPFFWDNATIYFMLTDRFHNGDPSNDQAFNRKPDGAVLRSYLGGDLKGITQKLEEGYFQNLGINALWITPHVEQVKGFTNEGTGKTYAFHGYWAADWTQVDPNLGTYDDLKTMVDTAHAKGIRVLFDVVINHTGPAIATDPAWPDSWVRTEPQCDYSSRRANIECTLVKNLPDIRTESDAPVELPPQLVAKWKQEGRYAQEVAELDAFFKRTGLPRAPRYYLMKWHTDWVRELGVDGFRIDTAKHTEAEIWKELAELASVAFNEWKAANPDKVLSDDPFYMTGEVYNYSIGHGKRFPYTETDVENFYDDGFDSLINFGLKGSREQSLESVFSEYSAILNGGELDGYGIVNYLSSHDDGNPYDRDRKAPLETGTRLLLAPGTAQIYYGDELARPLSEEGAEGDAHLRRPIDWEALAHNEIRSGVPMQSIYEHWAKLGRFRAAHPAIGMGTHQQIAASPYTFSRILEKKNVKDRVVVAVGGDGSPLTRVTVTPVFKNGMRLINHYTGESVEVRNGEVTLSQGAPLALLAAH